MVTQDMSSNCKLLPFLASKKFIKRRTDIYPTLKSSVYLYKYVSIYGTLQCCWTLRYAILLYYLTYSGTICAKNCGLFASLQHLTCPSVFWCQTYHHFVSVILVPEARLFYLTLLLPTSCAIRIFFYKCFLSQYATRVSCLLTQLIAIFQIHSVCKALNRISPSILNEQGVVLA